ncbi:hypothetical protein NMY22_g2715 [Coprinellus aureogranulatus]|nr:hypothetical protein NMY22_g2715 [Coprinellus aureogranulatus]
MTTAVPDASQCRVWRQAQKDIDAQIFNLKRRRNELAPISTLPPEILARVFFLSDSTFDTVEATIFNPSSRTGAVPWYDGSREPRPFPTVKDMHDCIPLSHVCHEWRVIICNTPYLWTHVQIQRDYPKRELTDYVLKNSRSLPLTVDFIWSTCWQTEGSDEFKHRDFVAELFRPRVLGTTINLAAFPTLESFEFVNKDGYSPRLNLDNFLSGGAPNLRSLDIAGAAIPWTSPMLRSPCLTHLTLHDTQILTVEDMSDLLSFLHRAPQLKTLGIGMGRYSMIDDPSLGNIDAVAPPIKLPSLEALHLNSNYFLPLSIILSSIQVPPTMKSLIVTCEEAEQNLQPLTDFVNILGNPITPAQIEIGQHFTTDQYFVKAWDVQTACLDTDGDDMFYLEPNRLHLYSDEPVWIILQTGSFPFPQSNGGPALRLPWSFNNLGVISIGRLNTVLPTEFWIELSRLPDLEVVRFKWTRIIAVQPFLNSLVAPQSRQEGVTNDDAIFPFLGLRAVTFEGMRRAVRYLRHDLHEFPLPSPAIDVMPSFFSGELNRQAYMKYIASFLFYAFGPHTNREFFLDEVWFKSAGEFDAALKTQYDHWERDEPVCDNKIEDPETYRLLLESAEGVLCGNTLHKLKEGYEFPGQPGDSSLGDLG